MAQWIRHLTTNQGIPGSSPGGVANFCFVSGISLNFWQFDSFSFKSLSGSSVMVVMMVRDCYLLIISWIIALPSFYPKKISF